MWQLIDNSDGERKGWLTIMKDGIRVADAFPFAANADAAFVREQAQRIVETMNQNDMIAAGSTELPPLGDSRPPLEFSEVKKERHAGWPARSR